MTRLLAAFALVVLALAACSSTPPTPTPSPSASSAAPEPGTERPIGDHRVAVVVAPVPALRAATAEISARQVPAVVEGIGDVRVVTADDPGAMDDLVRLFASEGYDLVCALGPGALDAVLGVARDLPSTQFCAGPVIATETPANVLAVDIRSEEMAYLAGVMAGAYAPDRPPVMVTAASMHASARQQQAFRDGFASTAPSEGVVPIIVGPLEDSGAVAAALEEHLRAGVSAVYTDGGEADLGAVIAAAAESARRTQAQATPDPEPTEDPTAGAPTTVLVIGGPAVLPLEEGVPVPAEVAYVVEMDWAQAVVVAARRLVGTWEGGVVSIGLLEEALRFREDGGAAVPPGVRTRVEDTRAGIIDGRLTIGTQP